MLPGRTGREDRQGLGAYPLKTTSTYGAELISVMGNDLTVVNAARVSFDKVSDYETVFHTVWEDDVLLGGYTYNQVVKQLKDADARLISYLAREGHWTPFAHPQLSFRVSAPIFVARQLQKHQIGLAWNEVSRRYVDSEPVIYVPETWRKRADNVKQGSSDEIVEQMQGFEYIVDHGFEYYPSTPSAQADKAASECVSLYDELLSAGVCPEQARMVLPQSMMTEWVWTGSLAAFARVCNQRLDSHAQRECAPVAQAIAKALDQNFPVSWTALRKQ